MAGPSSFSKSARKSPRKRAMLRSAVGPVEDLASDGRTSYADMLAACAERQALATRRAESVRAA